MVGFTKLHQCIVHSSIWSEPMHVRVVWISMLAMSNENGMVEASVGGLARACNVTRDECLDALNTLMSPDPESRDGTSGERVQKVEGGFWIINYANYRDRQTEQQRKTAERVRKHRARAKKREESVTDGDVTPAVTPVTPVTTEAEAEAEAEEESTCASRDARPPDCGSEGRPKKPKAPLSMDEVDLLDPHWRPVVIRFSQFWDAYAKKVGRRKAEKLWLRMSVEDQEQALAAVEAYVRAKPDKRFRKDPDSWLRNECWHDEVIDDRGGRR